MFRHCSAARAALHVSLEQTMLFTGIRMKFEGSCTLEGKRLTCASLQLPSGRESLYRTVNFLDKIYSYRQTELKG